MNDLKEKVLRRAFFDEASVLKHATERRSYDLGGFWKTKGKREAHSFYTGAREENARLFPLLSALADSIQEIRNEAAKAKDNGCVITLKCVDEIIEDRLRPYEPSL